MVSEEHENIRRVQLLQTGMAIPVPEDALPLTFLGRPLLAGLFAVPHKADKDRLIEDRRPANFLERRLD